jgi:hypothetical protein
LTSMQSWLTNLDDPIYSKAKRQSFNKSKIKVIFSSKKFSEGEEKGLSKL